MTKPKLSERQEAFAILVATGKPLVEAYRHAGFTGQGNVAYVGASKLAKVGKVAVRIEAIRQEQARATFATMVVTAHTVTEMLSTVFANATRDKQHGAAATAAMGIAKLHGLLVDRVEDVTRRASRDPHAPKEVTIEGWLDEQRVLMPPSSPSPDLPVESPDLPVESPAEPAPEVAEPGLQSPDIVIDPEPDPLTMLDDPQTHTGQGLDEAGAPQGSEPKSPRYDA